MNLNSHIHDDDDKVKIKRVLYCIYYPCNMSRFLTILFLTAYLTRPSIHTSNLSYIKIKRKGFEQKKRTISLKTQKIIILLP